MYAMHAQVNNSVSTGQPSLICVRVHVAALTKGRAYNASLLSMQYLQPSEIADVLF